MTREQHRKLIENGFETSEALFRLHLYQTAKTDEERDEVMRLVLGKEAFERRVAERGRLRGDGR